MVPTLYIIVPCRNEEDTLLVTAPYFLDKIEDLSGCGKISEDSRVVFVDDGSIDNTFNVITELSCDYTQICGISLSRNFGQQSAIMAGFRKAWGNCDCAVSIDCDGQDDINVIDKMLDEYLCGYDIVYGIPAKSSDKSFKRKIKNIYSRFTGEPDKAGNYNLISDNVLNELLKYNENDFYMSELLSHIGFKSTGILYKRRERTVPKKIPSNKNNFKKILSSVIFLGILFAVTGIFGMLLSAAFLIINIGMPFEITMLFMGCFLIGSQMLFSGIVLIYFKKIYSETKQRPQYIIKSEV